MVQWSIVFLQGRKQGWSVTPLCLSLLFCVYIFWFMLCLFLVFLLCFGLMFPFLTLYVLWVVFCVLCCSRLIALFFSGFSPPPGSRFSSPFYRLPSWLPLTSPAFAGLLSSTNEIVGERRGPRLDRIRCRFSACWIGMEKTNTAVLPAATTFRQEWTFSFWPLNFGNSAIGPLRN